jgi:hypothetical protein
MRFKERINLVLIKIHYKNQTPDIHRIGQFPCKIGRSAANHIVIMDDSVSTEHAEIRKEDQGGITIYDLNSTNGIYFNQSKVDSIPIQKSETLYIGSVVVEIINYIQDEFEEKTRIINIEEIFQTEKKRVDERRNILIQLITPIFIFIAITLFYKVFYQYIRGKDFLYMVLSLLVTCFLITAPVSFFSKIISKKFNFVKLWFACAIFFLFIELNSIFERLAQYTFNIDLPISKVGTIIAFWAGLIYAGQLIFNKINRKKIMIYCSGLVIGIYVGLFLISWIDHDENYDGTQYKGSFVYPFKNHEAENKTTLDLIKIMDSSLEKVEQYRQEEIEAKIKKENDGQQ